MKNSILGFCKRTKQFIKHHAGKAVAVITVAATATTAKAAPADPTTLITDVSTAFDSTTVVVVAMMGFSLLAVVIWKFLKKGK